MGWSRGQAPSGRARSPQARGHTRGTPAPANGPHAERAETAIWLWAAESGGDSRPPPAHENADKEEVPGSSPGSPTCSKVPLTGAFLLPRPTCAALRIGGRWHTSGTPCVTGGPDRVLGGDPRSRAELVDHVPNRSRVSAARRGRAGAPRRSRERPSCSSSEAKLWRSAYGVAPSTPAPSPGRSSASAGCRRSSSTTAGPCGNLARAYNDLATKLYVIC
jgi:hypothetical protein